ncbi:hypothetical protein Nepgr_029965 [Nepenthes gracilis]|uniref:SLH domain-containing protein n=1 Tax=Nepenthes gracilis TaxID=150966 RepID=A0AAD3Y3I2_NEPGR|nr:hypothetical protein Nepgr_029965 [Nepenthes gracilis]
MTSLTSTWSSSSYHLQFPFKFRKSPTTLFVRTRMISFDRRFRFLCVVGNGSGSEQPRVGNSWTSSDGFADASSDWSGSELSKDSQQQQRLGGVVGAGVAGVLLVTGLTFAALSIGKRSNSRLKQEMVPLTKQQEDVLTLADEDSISEINGKEGKDIVQDERNPRNEYYQGSNTGLKENSPSSSESTEDNKGTTPVDNDAGSSKHNKRMSSGHDASIQENSPYDSVFDSPNALDTNLSSHHLPETEIVDGLSDTSGFTHAKNILATGRPEENSAKVELSNISPYSSNLQIVDLTDPERILGSSGSNTSPSHLSTEPEAPNGSVSSNLDVTPKPPTVPKGDEGIAISLSDMGDVDRKKTIEVSNEGNNSRLGYSYLEESVSTGTTSELSQSFADKQGTITNGFESQSPQNSFLSSGIPAPSILSESLKVPPGKVLVPAVVDQVQGQALVALQVLKVIEGYAQPSDLCTRRDYARWLVSASGALSRISVSKVYPAMYIENVTELAFDDILPEDPDFSSIQGLAEAGLISSKLSRRDMLSSSSEDMGPFYFFPDSPLSRQDLVTWKMVLEKRQLPVADRKILHNLSGFIDIDRIDPDAWPALVADLSAGEHGIIALAFGCTRLFQPDKPVTNAQAAIALATGEAADMVSEELARIEAESMAENAVAAHNALVAEVEKDVNASFEKELLIEREKIDAMEKMAEEARQEAENLQEERKREKTSLMKERAAIESEMEVLSRLRREVEEQLESLMIKKVEVSYEKERIEKLKKSTEEENLSIARLQYELEVERKALAMARAWAEDEAKRVSDHAKALEEARDRWDRHGVKVVVDDSLHDDATAGVTWLNVEKQLSLDGTVKRGENLVDKLEEMAAQVRGRSREIINTVIESILLVVLVLKRWIVELGRRTIELKEAAASNVSGSVEELRHRQAAFQVAVTEGAKRVVGDCRGGVEKLTQKFKV